MDKAAGFRQSRIAPATEDASGGKGFELALSLLVGAFALGRAELPELGDLLPIDPVFDAVKLVSERDARCRDFIGNTLKYTDICTEQWYHMVALSL